jgi:putative sigma-54 modulation protein
MQINITAKGVEVPLNLKDLAEKKLVKLQRLLHNLGMVDITCSRERQWRVLEITINADGLLIRAEERAADFPSALDSLCDKLERRVKKSRSRMVQRYREAPDTREAWAALMEEEEEAPVQPGLVRSKRFAVKPMSPEEAAAEMELLSHDFYVFKNAETGEVNVLYRRKDGNYGLIEPEF